MLTAFWASEIFMHRVRSHVDRRRMACQLVVETVASPLVYDEFVMQTLCSISRTGPGASSRVLDTDPCRVHPRIRTPYS